MKMDVKIGNWSHEFSVFFTAGDLEYLNDLGWSKGVDVDVIDNRIVFMVGDGNCQNIHQHNNPTSSSIDWPCGLVVKIKDEDGIREAHKEFLKLPFWGFTIITSEIDEDDGTMVIELPPIHEMTWPGPTFKLTAEQWVGVIEERLRSMMAAGVKNANAPKHVRAHSGCWREALSRIKADEKAT